MLGGACPPDSGIGVSPSLAGVDYTLCSPWIYERLSISSGYTSFRSIGMPLTIPVKAVRIGNSLRMTIPKPVAEALGIAEGDTLDVGVDDGSMVVRRRGAGGRADTILGVERRPGKR